MCQGIPSAPWGPAACQLCPSCWHARFALPVLHALLDPHCKVACCGTCVDRCRSPRIQSLISWSSRYTSHPIPTPPPPFTPLHTPYAQQPRPPSFPPNALSALPVGAFIMTETLLPHLARGASIIHISSTRALQSEPHSEAYAASKAGLLGLTHAQVRQRALLHTACLCTSPSAGHQAMQCSAACTAGQLPPLRHLHLQPATCPGKPCTHSLPSQTGPLVVANTNLHNALPPAPPHDRRRCLSREMPG